MALTLHQVQKQTQKLIMTPQMQQSIQLLQMSAQELEQLATNEMMENPFLEIAEDAEGAEEDKPKTEEEAADSSDLNEATVIDFTYSQPEDAAPTPADSPQATAETDHFNDMDVNWDECYDDADSRVYTPTEPVEEERDFADYVALRQNLYDNLKWQLHVSMLDRRQLEIGEYLIGSIDDDGYLRIPLEELAADIGCSVEEVERVLAVIQTFEPVGVGARNLGECLRIQLENRGVRDKIVFEILDRHLDQLQKKKFKEIARELKIDEARVRDIFHQLSHLEPKPGRARNAEDVKYIQPDVYVKKVDDKYMIYLNEGKTSGLRINRYYRNLLQNGGTFDDKDKVFAMEKYKAAIWLIKNIEKRKSTILKVSEAVMNFQKDFLEKGVSALRPLTLKEIAEVVGMHESTVARVTTNKYIETPRGIFELKYFFSPGLGTDGGEEASSTSIKEMLAELIANENPKRPYSDQKLAELIRARGINIARRTVAKYREQLKILSAKMRKEVA